MKRDVETPAFAAMLRRMIRAHGRRCGRSDPVDLRELADLKRVVDDALGEAVSTLRTSYGFSWQEIAEGLGVTKQTAFERFHDRK